MWLTQTKNGDRIAFCHIAEKYQQSIYNLCYRMLNNPDDAEDAVQEIFTRAYSRLDSYDVLSPTSEIFENDEKSRIRYYCEKTGCTPEYRYGYLFCGLLLTFKHGCPDNSLPIIWQDNHLWKGLFKRSGL